MVVPLYEIRKDDVHDRDPYKMYSKLEQFAKRRGVSSPLVYPCVAEISSGANQVIGPSKGVGVGLVRRRLVDGRKDPKVSLAPLKDGFKAGMRDLLGLDGAFNEGTIPEGIIPAIANLFPNAEQDTYENTHHENMKKSGMEKAYKEQLRIGCILAIGRDLEDNIPLRSNKPIRGVIGFSGKQMAKTSGVLAPPCKNGKTTNKREAFPAVSGGSTKE
ncbi:hypothetical protein Tco_1361701 [Tanacetum coccineum]